MGYQRKEYVRESGGLSGQLVDISGIEINNTLSCH